MLVIKVTFYSVPSRIFKYYHYLIQFKLRNAAAEGSVPPSKWGHKSTSGELFVLSSKLPLIRLLLKSMEVLINQNIEIR